MVHVQKAGIHPTEAAKYTHTRVHSTRSPSFRADSLKSSSLCSHFCLQESNCFHTLYFLEPTNPHTEGSAPKAVTARAFFFFLTLAVNTSTVKHEHSHRDEYSERRQSNKLLPDSSLITESDLLLIWFHASTRWVTLKNPNSSRATAPFDWCMLCLQVLLSLFVLLYFIIYSSSSSSR